jgi:hypothetical protein
MSHTNQSAVAGPQVFERGGLTSVNGLVVTTAVARFDFCEHCDIEVPVDGAGLCTYCFLQVPEDEDE